MAFICGDRLNVALICLTQSKWALARISTLSINYRTYRLAIIQKSNEVGNIRDHQNSCFHNSQISRLRCRFLLKSNGLNFKILKSYPSAGNRFNQPEYSA